MKTIRKRCFMLICAIYLAVFVPQDLHAADSMQASASAVSSGKIEIKWTAAEGAGSYAVYRRTSSEAAFKQLAQTFYTVYKDTKAAPAVTYYYKIVPIDRSTSQEMDGIEAVVKAKTPRKIEIEKVSIKSSAQIQLYWKPSAGAAGYQIFRSDNEEGAYLEIGRKERAADCAFSDAEVMPGKVYYYKIRPFNDSGVGSYSAAKKGQTVPKTEITSLIPLSSNQMKIAWKKVKGACSYEIYRSASADGGYKKIADIKRNVCYFTDQTVKSGRRYYYKILVTGNLDGVKIVSGYSKAVAFRSLQKVKISSVEMIAGDTIKIRWKKVAGAAQYRIFRAESLYGAYKKIATVPKTSSTVLSYTDTKVSSGRTYYYKVQAYAEEKGIVSAGSGSKSDAAEILALYSIMGKTSVTADQMAAFYKSVGKSYPASIYQEKGAGSIEEFCKIVIEESKKEGVKAEVIFAQVCLETGYLQFSGQVSVIQCNFSGLGATDDGAAGATFPDVRTGIRAQVQHMKGYASTQDLNQECVDPRFIYLASRRGTAPNVENLGNGNWATDPNYAYKLMKLIKAMKS